MNKVKLKGHENVATRIDPKEVDHLILVDEGQLKKIKDGVNLWTEKKFNMSLDACQKIIVESYYCGFIDYYDTATRNGMVEHDIYFDWTAEGPVSRVAVYILPAPVKTMISDPFRKSIVKKGRVKSTDFQRSPLPPPTATSTSDPVEPTGPPPPPSS